MHKALKLLSGLLIGLLFTSCDSFYFESPLPLDRPALDAFPKELQGHYKSDWFQDLEIRKNRLILRSTDTSRLPLKTSRLGLIYEGDQVYLVDSTEKSLSGPFSFLKAEQELLLWREREVVLKLDSRRVLKRCGKNYIFNYREDEDQWWQQIYLEKQGSGLWQMKTIERESLALFDELRVLYQGGKSSRSFYLNAPEASLQESNLKEMAESRFFVSEGEEGLLQPKD